MNSYYYDLYAPHPMEVILKEILICLAVVAMLIVTPIAILTWGSAVAYMGYGPALIMTIILEGLLVILCFCVFYALADSIKNYVRPL